MRIIAAVLMLAGTLQAQKAVPACSNAIKPETSMSECSEMKIDLAVSRIQLLVNQKSQIDQQVSQLNAEAVKFMDTLVDENHTYEWPSQQFPHGRIVEKSKPSPAPAVKK